MECRSSLYCADVQEKEVDFRSHMQKIKSMNVDGIHGCRTWPRQWHVRSCSHMKQVLVQDVRRIGSSSASNAPVPTDCW